MALSEGGGKVSDTPLFKRDYKYKGVSMLGFQTAEIFEGLKDWETREDDIYFVVFPKSGTHWIFEIISLIMNDGDVDKVDRSHIQALDFLLLPTCGGALTGTPGYEAIKTWQSPRIILTHMLEEFTPDQVKKCKIIVFSRNPKDLCVAWLKFFGSTLTTYTNGWNGFLSLFLSDEMFFGSWFRHIRGWYAHRDASNFLFCKYEDFNKDLKRSVQLVADFLGRPLSEELLTKIVDLTEIKGMKKTYQQVAEKIKTDQITTQFSGQPFLRKGD